MVYPQNQIKKMLELLGGTLLITGAITISLGVILFLGGIVVSCLGYLFYLFSV